jgi:hypothetical protein
MTDLVLKKIEIFSGHREDSPETPRWYVNHHYTDGGECIVDDKTSHREAWASALESASEEGACLPIEDNCTFR